MYYCRPPISSSHRRNWRSIQIIAHLFNNLFLRELNTDWGSLPMTQIHQAAYFLHTSKSRDGLVAQEAWLAFQLERTLQSNEHGLYVNKGLHV